MEKSNKLIAEFMGYEVKYNKCYSPKYNDGTIAPMQFHKSWDWLMPVIQKCLIGQTEVSRGLTNTNVSRILDALCYQDISRTYKAVVEFIKENNDGTEQ